jgi:ABC-type branched-subunit amino acid transport system substrate-binding protein
MIAFTNNRTAAGEGAFVIGFLPSQRVARVIAYAASRGATRFAALIPDGPYGEQVAASFHQAVQRAGGLVVRTERYAPGIESATEAVKRLASYDVRRAVLLNQQKALADRDDEVSRRARQRLEARETVGDVEFDAVLIPETGEAITTLAPLLPYYDIDTRKIRILGINDWSDRALRREPALKGAWYAGPAPEAREAFAERFRRIYQGEPHALAPLAYDATALAAVLGAREAGADYSIDALSAPNGFAGSAGLFRLRPNGLVEHRFAVFEVQPDEVKIVSPAPQAFDLVTN